VVFSTKIRTVIFHDIVKKHEFEEFKDKWELAFSLDDRQAHRDRPRFFREHSTEIGDILRILPKICERINEIANKFLTTYDFEYDKKGAGLVGHFKVGGLPPSKTTEIQVGSKEAQRIMKTIMSSLKRNPREFIPLSNILIIQGVELECQIAILRALIKRELIRKSDDFGLYVTPKGIEELEKLLSKSSLPDSTQASLETFPS